MVLREDAAGKQEELMRTLQALQSSQTRAEDLRRQNCDLAGQLDIVRNALQQTDFDVDQLCSHLEEARAAQSRLEVREQECEALNDQLVALA